MFWMVIALLILMVSLVFFMLGIRLLSEDRKLDRPFMPIKTRVFYALGNVGIALTIYTLYFWIEDNFLDWRGNDYEITFSVCIIIAMLFVAAAIFCLVNSKIKIRYKDGTGDAANGDGMQPSGSVPAKNPTTSDTTPNSDLNTAHCPKCGNTMMAGHKFCSVCGTPIESVAKTVSKVCGFCGEKVGHEEVYCPNCGHRL